GLQDGGVAALAVIVGETDHLAALLSFIDLYSINARAFSGKGHLRGEGGCKARFSQKYHSRSKTHCVILYGDIRARPGRADDFDKLGDSADHEILCDPGGTCTHPPPPPPSGAGAGHGGAAGHRDI